LRINAQVQILSLVAVRLHELARQIDPDLGRELLLEPYRTLSIMLTGQRMELVRNPWDIATYEAVARLSAGEQFGTYMRIAVAAGEKTADVWIEYGRAFGTLLQIVTDLESKDPRLTKLPVNLVTDLCNRIQNELTCASKMINMDFISYQTTGIEKRCSLVFQTG
jgi:hypothetical protein